MIRLTDKIYISPAIFIVFFIFSLLDGVEFVFIIYFCATLHEIAHIFTALLCGCAVERVRILTIGADIALKNGNTISYKKELLIALSGPLCNLFFALIAILLEILFGITPFLQMLALSNTVLFLLNILPIMPLDGGRALYSLLLMKTNVVRAAFISDVVSLITIAPLVGLGLYLLYLTGYNFSLLVISIYILAIFIAKNILLREK